MKTNIKQKIYTHEGGKAFVNISKENQLRRTVMSCLLWENQFYESGVSIADRIVDCAKLNTPGFVNNLAVEAKTQYKLRHVPLLLATIYPNAETIEQVIGRADELAEIVSIYWRNGKLPLPAQMKKGIAKAFNKFDEYQFAKYDRDGLLTLRDVMFLVHPKPVNKEQAKIFERIADKKLQTPNTWEVLLSGGADKKETFERLLSEKKLGYMALLRNLRNMTEAKVDENLIRNAILNGKAESVLPFRFIAAARNAVKFEPALDVAMQKAIKSLPVLNGKTIVLVDVSGSMDNRLSSKSDMNRMDAAAALGVLVKSDFKQVFTFSEKVVEIPPRLGMAGIDAIIKSQYHSGTHLREAINAINQNYDYDRLIVITDEQSNDGACDPKQDAKGYMINVASYQNGVGYGRWVNISGFSENIIKYIVELENNSLQD